MTVASTSASACEITRSSPLPVDSPQKRREHRAYGVDAIIAGGATELYGSTAGGVTGFIGYRILGDRVAISRLDEDATIVHRAPV